MGALLKDLRYGARMLVRAPGFTIVAVLTLALGIGANTAIFSVVDAVLLRPLPFEDPDRLVLIFENNPGKGWDRFTVAAANYLDWRAQSHAFDEIAAFTSGRATVTGGGDPEQVPATFATASLLPMLGVSPALGRAFGPDDDRPGAQRVAILSHGIWQTRYGGDPGILGVTVSLNGETHVVIGVMPEDFRFQQAQVLLPMAWDGEAAASRGAHRYLVMGRLRAGVSLEEARAEMSTIASRLQLQHPETNAGWGVFMSPLREESVGSVRTPLLVLLAAVSFVLLIACANVANLLLTRASARRKEIAIRAALGAGRARLLRQLLTESTLLATLGGALGVLFALWGTEALLASSPPGIPRLSGVRLDGRVLGFTAGVSLVTGLLFGLLPAARASRGDVQEGLKEVGRTSAAGRRRLDGLLVAGEMALSVVLLIGAGLLARSFWQLLSVDPGFSTQGILSASVSLPARSYGEGERQAAFFQQLLERLAAGPGLSAAATSTLPSSDQDSLFSFFVEGRPAPDPSAVPSANYYAVSPDYFRLMGIRLLRGRTFTEQDSAGAPRVAIVNEVLVSRIFGDADPLGKRIRIGWTGGPEREIVGVVAATRQYGLGSEFTMQMYDPYLRDPASRMTLLVRGGGDPAGAAPFVRREVQAMDGDLPLADVRTLEEMLSRSVAPRRFTMTLMLVFAGLAVLLASVGLYGVVSYSVAQRTHEIGVRMALGACRGDVLRLLVREGMTFTLPGLASGLIAAAGLSRLLSTMLFGVNSLDPATYASVPLLLAGVASLAAWIPARRAARLDPVAALRHE